MEIEHARELVSGKAPELSELRQHLQEHHSDHPQRAMLADKAMGEIEDGLRQLASLGHRYVLVEQDKGQVQQYPRMLYRDGAGGQETLIVNDEREENEAHERGWRQQQRAPTAEPTVEPPPEPPVETEPPTFQE